MPDGAFSPKTGGTKGEPGLDRPAFPTPYLYTPSCLCMLLERVTFTPLASLWNITIEEHPVLEMMGQICLEVSRQEWLPDIGCFLVRIGILSCT